MFTIHYTRDGSRYQAGPFRTPAFVKRWIRWALRGATDITIREVAR